MQNPMLETLNDRQKEAAMCHDRPVRIVAGAGSGKTRVLMNRIAWLVDELGIAPWRIMAITFTNKAAREMRERLEVLLGEDAKKVRISTIHSLCLRMLREDAGAIGYPARFAVLDTEDQKAILRRIYKDLEVDRNELSPSRALGMISNWKTALMDPEKAKSTAFILDDRIAAEVYRQYEAAKTDMQAMDFDDLLLNARTLLKNPEIRLKWQDRLDYIHVDEFQDVDPIQYDIIKALTGDSALLAVVGDPDQTIYTWRGADVDIILRFDKDFPDSKTVILDRNYRSTKPILEAANAVIANNRNRIKKDLYTEEPGEKRIEEYEAGDENEEPLQVARDLLDAHKAGRAWKDMAVLYRSNYCSRAFERVFAKLRIPHIIYGGIRFYERAEIKDMLSYLKLLQEPRDKSVDLAVQRVINVPRRGIGQVTVAKVQASADSQETTMLDVLENPEGFSTAVTKKLTAFSEQVAAWKALKGTMPLEDLLRTIAEESGYLDMLSQAHEDDRIENINELYNDIALARRENPDLTLEDYLQDISLYTDRDNAATGDAVALMTVHAAKGLEFDEVHIVNLNEGVFPSERALQDGLSGLEEERRLLYVAMTRARKELFLSWNLGYSFQQQRVKTPSRFLKEIPMACVEKEEPEARPQVVSNKKPMKPRKDKLRNGDLVEHAVYGDGVIVKLAGNIANIAFAKPHGIKQLNINHPSIKKKERT